MPDCFSVACSFVRGTPIESPHEVS
jgi:hypothetical protein